MKRFVFAAFVAMVGLLGGCMCRNCPCCSARPQGQIKVRAYIDGSDTLKVQGDKLWYEHGNYNLPGKEGGVDEPTYINGVAWKPVWNGKISQPYMLEGQGASSKRMRNARLDVHQARGQVSIVEYPTPANGQTLTIKFDDDQINSAAWYDVSINW